MAGIPGEKRRSPTRSARHRAGLHGESRLFPGHVAEQKKEKLAKITYADYLTQYCKLTPEALPFFQTFPADLSGVGIDAVPALYCFYRTATTMDLSLIPVSMDWAWP